MENHCEARKEADIINKERKLRAECKTRELCSRHPGRKQILKNRTLTTESNGAHEQSVVLGSQLYVTRGL